MAKHSEATAIHTPFNWIYADATAREAEAGAVPADINKLALQQDDSSVWILTDDSPLTWAQVGGASAGDMLKATYDPDDDGVVEEAALAYDLDIDSMAEESSPASGDMLVIDRAGVRKKVDVDNLPSGGGGGVASGADAFFVDEATVTVGNAFTLALDGNQRYGWWQYQNAAANGDTWKRQVFLKAGTYTIHVLGMTAPSRGIQEIFIDGSSVGTMDWYSGGLVYNVEKTISSVVIGTDGDHEFKSVVNGKNGSSSDYQLLLTKVWIK